MRVQQAIRRNLFKGVGVTPLVFTDLTEAQTFAAIYAPGAVNKAWCDLGFPTVQVEKGWGSGVFADLYPDLSNNLWTGRFGTGQLASTWAGSSKLLVSRIYNQAGSSASTDYISPVSDALRVLLNLTISGAPRFAGYGAGTQDANQHATQRGYALPASLYLKTNERPLSMIAAHQHVTGGSTVNIVQDAAVGTTAFWVLDPNVKRQYANWAIAISFYDPVTTPQVSVQWALADGRGIATEYAQRSGQGGVYRAPSMATSSATSRTLNIFGPASSLHGYCYGLMLATGALTPASMLSGGIPKKLARLYAAAVTVDQPTIHYPYSNAVVHMNLATQTADIPIKLVYTPATAMEASWQGAAYVGIGTTDANGALDTSLPAQAKGNGTLNIRAVGRTTPVAIANVAVGYVFIALGESNPDGRGENVPVTIPTGSLRKSRIDWTALQAYGTSPNYPSMITTPGTGYTVNDILTWVGGTGTAASVRVTSVDGGGAVTAIINNANGNYSVAPSAGANNVSGGTGSGCQLTATFALGNQYWLSFLQKIYDQFACVIAVEIETQGSTYFARTGADIEGPWSTTTAVANGPALAASSRSELLGMQADFITPKIHLDVGLNDAALGATQAQYLARAQSLMTYYRDGLNNQALEISLAVQGEGGSVTAAQLDGIRAAQLQLWAAAGGYVPAGSFAHLHADAGDDVHYSTLTVKQKLAAIMFRYDRHKWLGGAQARAPQYSSAIKSGATITVTLTGGTSPMTLSGGSGDVAGWKVVDGAGTRTVTGVAVSGLDVTLTCDQVLTGAVTVQWGSYNTSIGTTLLDSDATTPLPPEPFGPVSV